MSRRQPSASHPFADDGHRVEPETGESTSSAAFFARISRDLMEEHPESQTMQRVADRAIQVVRTAGHCGISMRRRRHRLTSVAATSDLAKRCDELQYQLEEGPCIDVAWEVDHTLVTDTSMDRQWPRWTRRVTAEGVGSVLTIRLATSSESLGALNLYAEQARAFSKNDVDVAVIYATHAANAMSSAVLVEGLRTAVHSRHLIGVAQGILMQNYALDMEHAFEVLRRYSSITNTKLRDVAEQVVGAGDLPDPSLRR